jgi:hypothetical protein
LRRHGVTELVIERGVDGFEHPTIGELREPWLDRIVESYPALLHQNHCGNRCNELRDGSDAKDGVALHGRRIVERQCAERLDVNVVMMTDKRDETRHFFTVDESGQHLMHAL